MSDSESVLNARARAFSRRLQSEFARAPDPRDVLDAEDELGTQAIAFELNPKGKRLLFRALDLERKAKLRRAAK